MALNFKKLLMKEFLRIFYGLDANNPKSIDVLIEFPCGSKLELKITVKEELKLKLVKIS